ncbi:MAG: UDP-glucose 4-epimerase-like protein [Thermogutta sp.]|nr:MAG: UDP-glucose 4-epimerase-like protein [Thermogutta sp.]
MPTTLVTGGAGFIGSHLVEALVERGHKVRVLDNLSTGNLANLASVKDCIEFIEGDICDGALVKRVMEGVEYVFHQAALASVPRSVEYPLDTHAACVTGTVTLLDAARRSGRIRRFVYAGSSSAYGDQPFSAKRETDLPDPISPYGAAKLAGEYYCRAFYATYGLPTVVIRYFNVFGPRQDPNSPYSAVIPLFITAILRGRRPVIFGDGLQSRDFTYVENVVHANLLAAEKPGVEGRVFNAANGKSITLLELIAALNEVLGTEVEPEFAPPRPGDIRESMADITLARRLLGYEPRVDFREGLRRSVEYYRHICQ